jgi:hypothetical protein
MKIGVTLPQFSEDAAPALAAARQAEALGLDGVFCFDHLWPIGQPDRPALSMAPLLGALVSTTDSVVVGSLVARVGLLPDQVLVASLASLAEIGPGRVIAGLGTGDSLSRRENEAFGVPFETADIRRRRMSAVTRDLMDVGIPVWIGGGRAKTVAVAKALRVPVNLWEAGPGDISALSTQGLTVTWGGPVRGTVAEMAVGLAAVARAGATWAVCAWPRSLEKLAEAVAEVRAAT